jgi:intracellular sulfur oxidation DsrE/DsrF family protein
MKTKLLLFLFLVYSSLNFAQKKEISKENIKFYFPASSFKNTIDYDKNLSNVVLKIAPMEIDEKNKIYSKNAESFYLIQKDYKGLVNYSTYEKFPKTSLPLKSYAEAMIADPAQGSQFKKTFKDSFFQEFNKMNNPTKTLVANDYFNEKMLDESNKSASNFKEQLSKNKIDSISYNDAIKLIDFESFNNVSKIILPLGKNEAKDYVHEFSQPYLTGNERMSVLKPKDVNDLPDLSKVYKLLFEIDSFSSKETKETAFKSENVLLLEAGRIINLHIASGIPAEKLKVVFVVRGPAIFFLLNDTMYKSKYKVENPNISLIKQMQSKGISFVVCGQTMTWGGYRLSDLTENVKEAVSAKTARSKYESQGYVDYELTNE